MTDEEYDNVPLSPVMVNQKNQETLRRDSKSDELSPNSISNMFNDFLQQFETMEKSGTATTKTFLDAVEEISDAVLKIKPSKILHPRVLHHPLIQFLHQMLVDILDNWRALDARLNIQESDIFLKIVVIFVRAVDQAPKDKLDEERTRIREILATKRLLALIREQIDDNIVNKQGINDDPSICILGLLTINLLRGCPFYFSAERNARLLDDLVMNCLDSYDYIHAVRQLQLAEPLTEIDRFLLFTCWDFVPFVSIDLADLTNPIHATASAKNTYHQLLTRFEDLLKKPPPVAPPSIAYILHRCFQLLSIPHLSSFDQHATHLISHLTHLLQQPQQDPPIIIAALEAFDNFVNHDELRATIKQQPQLTPLFTSFTDKQQPEQVRKLAFAILAQIIDEQQLAQHTNMPEMMAVFIEQLDQLDPNGYNEEADTALASLRALMQHDEMKSEFVRQGGLEKLASFIRDGNPEKQSIEQLTDAMKILWSCTFNQPDVVKTLQRDTLLMTRVHDLLERTRSKEELNADLEKAAEGLIWKVEKEDKFKEQKAAELEQKKQEKKRKAEESGQPEEDDEEEEEKYDLMISYSWADMDLVHRICHHLRDKLGYKIWLDQEQMHGSTIEAMASAVDSSQFILMCMSETYKRSANCQSEAEYAFNRKKHIVPLKLKKEYTPDGWLGFILGSRLYIDFGHYEFEKAIELLHNEIELQKKKRKDAKAAAKAESKQREETLKERKSSKAGVQLEDINTWNPTHVRDFLLKHNLTAMVPLCHGVTGEELLDLYGMCRANPSSMYRSLKFELLHTHRRLLPIATYLRFVTQVRSACGDGSRTENQE